MPKLPIIMFCFLCFTSSANGQNNRGQRYLAALSFLQTNPEVRKEIKQAFPKLLRDKKRCLQFTVDSLVQPIPLYFFDGEIKPENLGLSDSLIRNDQKFNREYGFEPYVCQYLSVVSMSEQSEMVLIFSKPINNFLIAEILDKRLYTGRFKQGFALQMLFLFNESGKVADVFFTKTMYN